MSDWIERIAGRASSRRPSAFTKYLIDDWRWRAREPERVDAHPVLSGSGRAHEIRHSGQRKALTSTRASDSAYLFCKAVLAEGARDPPRVLLSRRRDNSTRLTEAAAGRPQHRARWSKLAADTAWTSSSAWRRRCGAASRTRTSRPASAFGPRPAGRVGIQSDRLVVFGD